MFFLGIGLCFVSVFSCAIALAGLRMDEKKEKSLTLTMAPSIVLFAVLPLFLFRRVIREWPRLSIYSISILVSIAATISAAVVLVPIVTR